MIDVNSPPSVDIEANVVPIVESINTDNTDSPVVEEVPSDQVFQMNTESFNEEDPGGVIIPGMDYQFEVTSKLGAYDKHGTFYPEALPEKGILSIGGVQMKITYESGYFDEVSFLGMSSSLKIGKVFPYLAYIPSFGYGKAFNATNFAELTQGSESGTIYTNTREDPIPTYLVAPTIVGFPNKILPDRVEEGKKINEIPEGFPIEVSGLTQTDTGYLGFYNFCIKRNS